MDVAAAMEDKRVYPVTLAERKDNNIQISILSPLKRIKEKSEVRLGIDGIYMKKGNKSGTFLPQVAKDTNWNAEEFLGHCSMDKAGLGWDGWKTSELFTYEAVIFREND